MNGLYRACSVSTERLAAIAVTCLIFFILPSPVFHSVLHIDVKKCFVGTTMSLVSYLMLKKVRPRFSPKIFFLILPLLLHTALASLVADSTSQFLLGFTLLVMLLLSIPVVRLAFTPHSVNALYYLALFLLIGAWIGLFYSIAGGPALISFPNPDGRPNSLYLTTFTNSDAVEFWGLIRPSGVFDEPGAFSFFTILMVCLNELYGGSRRRSLVLLALGLVTLSLAHMLCGLAFLAVMYKRKIGLILLGLALVGGISAATVSKESLLYINLLSRFTISEDGGLVGDNRSKQVKEFFSLLDTDISRYGENVMVRRSGLESGADDQSSNPFSIWFGYGFLMWIPYVLTLALLGWHFRHRDKAVQVTAVLMTLLLLQRPYVYSMNWGFAMWAVVLAMLFRKKKGEVTACAAAAPLPVAA